MDYQEVLQQLDMMQLADIAWRILSEETVHDARDVAKKVNEAADIIKAAGLRILGLEEDGDLAEVKSRGIRHERTVAAVVADYLVMNAPAQQEA